MAVSTKIIKRRIKSIANTRKITKAMELVAGAKMRKSVQLATMSRSYSGSMQDIVARISLLVDPTTHPLLAGRPNPTSTLVIVAASDRGLCGGYNSLILKKTLEFLRGRRETLRVVTVGRRAELGVKRAGFDIAASFEAISNAPSFERTRPVGTLAYAQFMEGKADRVFVVYMDFQSAIIQVPIVMQLLPIIPETKLTLPLLATFRMNDRGEERDDRGEESDILFEPGPKPILDALLPRLLETQIYQALLESSASEHSARMMAMRNATDNASDMLQDLSFTYNQARQATITREISEISAGKAAIE